MSVYVLPKKLNLVRKVMEELQPLDKDCSDYAFHYEPS